MNNSKLLLLVIVKVVLANIWKYPGHWKINDFSDTYCYQVINILYICFICLIKSFWFVVL